MKIIRQIIMITQQMYISSGTVKVTLWLYNTKLKWALKSNAPCLSYRSSKRMAHAPTPIKNENTK